MDMYDIPTKIFSLDDNIHGVPIGVSYTCIVIVENNNIYYFYKSSGIITKNLEINAQMTQTAIANIQTQLKGM